MLGVLDNPGFPGAAKLADSPETRELMGRFADKYEGLRAAGMQPNDKLIRVLKAWRDEGLPGVRKLVQKGLAPAAAVAVFAGEQPAEQAAPAR